MTPELKQFKKIPENIEPILSKHFSQLKNDISRFNKATNSNVKLEDIDLNKMYKSFEAKEPSLKR